ncbi:ParB/RepB/Spo0J family partition protein [Bradyrhizobium sp. STM 3809]|uniref:ParB N-terminal domain-containing protein n=1 Tax=Bradyrhizobium sp. STM 3809 TaxID=551936 RepID=UPI00024075EE|nr:ParB/RepB/Spo0J family partition protein [Bradyrhizobium sp. STM 3809]CCD97736.1 putative ParB-like nuclease [Bradyrhizobium sp. STM 3809]
MKSNRNSSQRSAANPGVKLATKPLIRNSTTIALSGIAIPPERLRALRQDTVDALAQSMKRHGLIHPIALRKRAGRGYWVVAGAHRFVAAEELRWKEIGCVVLDNCSDNEAELIEIDEPLMRAELCPAERALQIERRKAIYEAAHPETKNGGDRKSDRQIGELKQGAKNPSRRVGETEKNDRLTKDTTEKTGQSERKVQRDVTRAEQLGDDLKRVVGTSLDKVAELDALAKMVPEARTPLIERVAAGEMVSVVKQALNDVENAWNAFYRAWKAADVEARSKFWAHHSAEYAEVISELSETQASRRTRRRRAACSLPPSGIMCSDEALPETEPPFTAQGTSRTPRRGGSRRTAPGD